MDGPHTPGAVIRVLFPPYPGEHTIFGDVGHVESSSYFSALQVVLCRPSSGEHAQGELQ